MQAKFDILETVTDEFETKTGKRHTHFLIGRDTSRQWMGPAVKLQLTNENHIAQMSKLKDTVVEVDLGNAREDWRGDIIMQVIAIRAVNGK